MTESREPFIAKKINKDSHDYSKLSIWCAVEALTYGTLSKSIEYAWDGDVSKRIAATGAASQTPSGPTSSRREHLLIDGGGVG